MIDPTPRRAFLRELGRGMFAITVGGTLAAACATGDDLPPPVEVTTTPSTPSTSVTTSAAAGSSTTETTPVFELTVHRVNLDFVSAYVLVRGAEAAVVDTGVAGSAAAIERGLAEVGLGWGDVGHVLLTHRHPDHVGSLGDVAKAAADAVLYAGAADVEAMAAPRRIEPVGDGDQVLDMAVVDTPGHTPGHISVFDPAASILVAGDALNGEGSGVETIVDGVGGPNPRFTADMDSAVASVQKLAAVSPDTIYFGHGEPKVGGAADALTALLARL